MFVPSLSNPELLLTVNVTHDGVTSSIAVGDATLHSFISRALIACSRSPSSIPLSLVNTPPLPPASACNHAYSTSPHTLNMSEPSTTTSCATLGTFDASISAATVPILILLVQVADEPSFMMTENASATNCILLPLCLPLQIENSAVAAVSSLRILH